MKTSNATIFLYNPDGSILLEVLVTKDSIRVESIMSDDYLELSWVSNENINLPIGCYLFDNSGEKLTLYDQYNPEEISGGKFKYTPKFCSVVSGVWAKTPLFFYTYESNGKTIVSKEPNWTLTDNAVNFLEYVAKVILTETGENWNISVASDLGGYKSIQFSNTDIISGLNAIADEWETEWYIDKRNKTLFLGKAIIGEAKEIILKVEDNIQLPTITENKEGYYNRFYAFGSTRNITQEYRGANVNNLVEKRLTLNPITNPDGYIDIRKDVSEPVLIKTLIFDEIYPKSSLVVAEARPRLMFTLDNDGNKIQIGTDANGEPIYDTYSIWYLQLKDSVSGSLYKLPNLDTYSKDNPDGVLISGKTLSIHFSGGALLGREFELTYHKKGEIITNSDGTPFEIHEGDFEILFSKDGDYIIPAQTGLIPTDGDPVILFNLRMPEEYLELAYKELKEAADKKIAEYQEDRNNYEFSSNPVAFAQSDKLCELKIGQAVTYQNGDYSYETRIIRIEKKLDLPCYQTITVGNEKIKGTRQQLEESVADANRDINLIASFNQIAQSAIDSYNRAIQQMTEGFARISNMWKFDPENENTIYSEFNVYSKRAVSSRGINLNVPPVGGGGKSNLSELLDVSLGTLADGESLVWDASQKKWVNRKIQGGTGGLNETELGKYLEDKKYATQQWVTDQGFLKNIFAATFEPGQFSERTYTPNLAAATVKIPTNTSHLVNDSGFIVSSILDNYVKKTGDTMTGNLTFGSMLNPLSFSRNSYNYINANAQGGAIAFIANGKNITIANSSMVIKDTSVVPGATNTYSLGENTYRWSNLFSVLGNFSYSLTIGKATLTWDESEQALKIDTGFYSDFWISSRGLNKDASGGGGISEEFLANYLTSKGYATQQWVQQWVTAQNYLTQSSLGNYVTLNTEQNITGRKVFSTPFALKMERETSNERGISWRNSTDDTTIAKITFHNTEQNIFFNPQGNENTWNDKIGNYSLKVGIDSFTYNTYPILRSDNFSTYLDGTYAKKTDLEKYLPLTGGTLTGELILSTRYALFFSGNSNYWGSAGTLTFYYGNEAPSNTVQENVKLRIRGADNIIDAGGNDKVALGASGFRWSNVYSVLGNFSTSISIGNGTISWDYKEGCFKFSHGLYSESFISSRGLNKGIEGVSGFGQLLTIQRNGVKIGEYNGATAQTINIAVPTNTSELTNGAGFITSSTLTGYAKETWVQEQLSNIDLSGYLKLSGGTMTGNIKFSQQYTYIDSTFDNGSSYGTFCFRIHDFTNSLSSLLRLRIDADGNKIVDGGTNGSTSLGATSFRWGAIYSVLGNFTSSVTASSFIKSGGTSSQFLKADGSIDSTTYAPLAVLDSYVKKSGDQMTGTLSFSSMLNPISLGRNSYNYINASAEGGSIAFIANGKDIGMVNATLIIKDTTIVPGASNTYFLGDSTYRWSNLYSVLGNFSGLISANGGITIPVGQKLIIGDIEITWDSEIQGLRFSKGVYSEEWISSRGLNPGVEGGGISEDFLKNYLTDNNYAKKSDIPSLTGYATETWVQTQLANIKLTDYLSLSGGAMRNTNLVTNMNADLLDSVHETGFMRRFTSNVNASTDVTNLYRSCGYTLNTNEELSTPSNGPFIGFGSSSYYKVLWGVFSSNTLRLRTNNNGIWSDWREFAFTDSNVASATYATSAGTATNANYATSAGNTDTLDNLHEISFMRRISSSLTSGSDITDLYRACGYALTSNTELAVPSNGAFIGFGASSYYKVLHGNATSNNLRLKTYNNGTWTDWRIFAFEDSNVASASRLATNSTFTAWGQTYFANGVPQSISGNMTGVGNVTPTSNVSYSNGSASNAWSNVYTNRLRSNTSLYIHSGSATTSILFMLGDTEYMRLSQPNGYLGIGTTSPSYKLHVVGTLYASGATTLASTLNVSGLITAQSGIKIGDGTITWDYSEGGGFKFSHGLYSEQWISAKGIKSDGLKNLDDYLPLAGGTMTGPLTFNISTAIAQITFTRNSCNYIRCSDSAGYFGFVSNGNAATSLANCTAVINNTALYPGKTSAYNLGTTTYRWNAIYGVTGNFSSAVTQNTSDLRLKTDIESVDCLEILCKVGNVFSFRYNSEAVADRPWLDTTTLHYGLAYQNAVRANIPGFTGKDDYGFGWLNFLSSDMLALLTGGVLELYLQQREIKNDVNSLRYRVCRLEEENQKLKERLKELEAA